MRRVAQGDVKTGSLPIAGDTLFRHIAPMHDLLFAGILLVIATPAQASEDRLFALVEATRSDRGAVDPLPSSNISVANFSVMADLPRKVSNEGDEFVAAVRSWAACVRKDAVARSAASGTAASVADGAFATCSAYERNALEMRTNSHGVTAARQSIAILKEQQRALIIGYVATARTSR